MEPKEYIAELVAKARKAQAQIADLQKRIAAEHGCEIVDHSLVLYVRKKK